MTAGLPRALLGAALLLGACKGDKGGDTGDVPAGPALSHTPPEDSLVEGASLSLSVSASDPDGVSSVVLYHRTTAAIAWDALTLQDGGDGTWSGTLEGLESPGLDYYFKATDDGDPAVPSYLPEARAEAPFALAVGVDALDLPFSEDFEPDEGESSLLELGWWSPSTGFPGSPWSLVARDDGLGYAALHPRSAAGTAAIEDWLISPPLDLSTLDAAMVRWSETGANVEAATHGLYLSTGSRDPADGDYVAVEEALPFAPEAQWGTSLAVDLSAWAGQPVVYLAWRYEGVNADDWRIDDVEVRSLAPDVAASLRWDPDPVHPGESASVTVLLENRTDTVGEGLTATLSLPEGGGSLDEDTVDVGTLPALGEASATFSLTVDPDFDDNRVLPLALSVTDGLDTWDFDLELVVGQRSVAALSLSLDDPAAVKVTVGVGDPDDPTAEVVLTSGGLSAGEHALSVDVTDLYSLLPPAAGEHRWFARVASSGVATVDAFTIETGGETYAATTLGKVEADVPATLWLPEPPALTVTAVSSSPTTVAPGDTGVGLTISVVNQGADTAGPVTGAITAVDPDVTVYGGAGFTVDADIWRASESHTARGLTIDVPASHTDSTPVVLLMALTDGVESWELEVEVPVPWPVLKIIGVTLDDDGGDGVLDPGESADVELTVANTGDLKTFGPLTAKLSLGSATTASVSLTDASGSFSSIAADSSRSEDFSLSVSGGAAGDVVELVLDLDDGTATYQTAVSLVLGDVPWFGLSTAEDAIGDNLDDYPFDLVSGQYRVMDGQLQLWLSSAVDYDPDTLFLESWGRSSGADYAYYRIVLQSGIGRLQGYNDGVGFSTIGDVEPTWLSSTDVILSWDVVDMGLLVDSFSLGIAAGWCGPDAYFCDHYPDGWGYPYDTFSSSGWYTLAW